MASIPIETQIPIPYKKIITFCEKHHILRMWLFGSVLRDDFTSESDIDVLVEFHPSHIPGWDIVSIQDELSQILERPVDLGTPNGLRERHKDDILSTARMIYEKS